MNSSKCLSGQVASSIAPAVLAGCITSQQKSLQNGDNFSQLFLLDFHALVIMTLVQDNQFGSTFNIWGLVRHRSPQLLKQIGESESTGKRQTCTIFFSSTPQLTESVVNILDGISDWPEDVVQEQSSAYVFNNHLQLLLLFFMVYIPRRVQNTST